ncbi:hypothetical protein NA56DRAFT_705555 [Hyaloscypha hepaticicola]|uniref:Uncharacterized protein n=1 Tax=Hyaloscypha hepaticicola TaxID=2082293 RepID=A0A2J6PZQ5_9HELO|nr:hypothetical protein NA56DRAFT_705555 [Hyaloscypha hepaticicola]
MQRAFLPRHSLKKLNPSHIHPPSLSHHLHSEPQPLLSTSHLHPPSLRLFSTQQPSKPGSPPPDPSFGGASFKDLGANRTVKIIVYSFLGTAATLESVAWTKFLWAKFGPAPKEGGEGEA